MNHRCISYTVAQFVFINHAAISLFDLTESDASDWAKHIWGNQIIEYFSFSPGATPQKKTLTISQKK